MSSISKQPPTRQLARQLGQEIRRRRLAHGLSQTQLGHPLSRAFVSSVERGRYLPSLGALVHMAHRLDVSAGELLDSVNVEVTKMYTLGNGSGQGQERPRH